MKPLRSHLRPLLRLRRRVLLHRRSLAALTAAGAVLAAFQATSPPPPRTVVVWTASRDLPSGTVLEQSDLATADLSPGTVPAHAIGEADEVVGHTLASPMSRGEVVTTTRTVTSGLLRGYPGATAVPLRVTDAALVDLLQVGDRVSFVVADPDGRASPRLLLEDVPVVAIPRVGDSALDSGTPGRLVIAAVPSGSASDVAATAATSILIPVWTR